MYRNKTNILLVYIKAVECLTLPPYAKLLLALFIESLGRLWKREQKNEKQQLGKGEQNKTTVGGVLRRGRLSDFGGKDRSESRSIEKVKSRNFACESSTIT